MSESEYTPTTEQVKASVLIRAIDVAGGGEHFKINAVAAKFDRWLAGVKADAWDEGLSRGLNLSVDPNPYRGATV
jgi:hypothetical protein